MDFSNLAKMFLHEPLYELFKSLAGEREYQEKRAGSVH